MLFSDTIPSNLQEYPNVNQFMDVLDALQNFKQELIARSMRVNNAGVLMDEKWLIKKLDEFGITNIPDGYPIQIIRQLLLNVDTVCRTRGSKIGIQLYCSVLSLGEVTVDDAQFYANPQTLILNSLVQGHITADNTNIYYYLVSDSSQLNPTVNMKITIKSRFFNGKYPNEAKLIKEYLESTINSQLGFSPDKKVTFVYQTRTDFYFHKLLNPYFV